MNNGHKIFLRAKKLDVQAGHQWVVVIHQKDAIRYGLKPGDELIFKWRNHKTVVVVDVTALTKAVDLVKPGFVGIFRDIFNAYKIQNNDLVEFILAGRPISVKAIQKKLLGKRLSYSEIYSIIKDIVDYRLDEVEIAFFVASAFDKASFSREEMYFLTKAMAETGEMLHFKNCVADKHSVGGLPGNRVTPNLVAILASEGVCIPKTSSRAITSAAGTADSFEVIAPVKLDLKKLKWVVKKTQGCLVWGGAVKLAPADDRILKTMYHLGIEPFSKMVVSIMAKKLAMGAKYLIIDMPVGKTAKIKNMKEARELKSLFKYIANKFGVKIHIAISKADRPIGQGIGPSLEARDILRVLQQKENRPIDLEKKSIILAGKLLELCGKAPKGKGILTAEQSLNSRKAWKKMQEIIKAQGGNPNIDSEKIEQGAAQLAVKSEKNGKIIDIDNKNLVEICRLLGAPNEKKAGIYLSKTMGDCVKKGEVLFTMHAVSQLHINLAKTALKEINIFTIK